METILTIGHSTRPLSEFLGLLQAHGVQTLADVRTLPRSRRHPHFSRETFPESLRAVGIGYEHLKGLGGLRHPRKDSIHTGWRTPGFRAYADYMQTAEFELNLDRLIALAKARQTAIMCAEAVPWRCHRQLIADALVVRGYDVEHILDLTRRETHALTSFARLEGTRLSYPAAQTAIQF